MQDNAIALAACAGTVAAGLALASAAALKGWNEWLALRRLELFSGGAGKGGGEGQGKGEGDLRALRERVRRLEAIASGEL